MGNGQRSTYELFLMLALLCVGASGERPRLRKAMTLFWAMAAVYVLFLGFDAEHIRHIVL